MCARVTLLPWHQIYQAAILEPDRHKIPDRIETARTGLAERQRQLNPNLAEERWELDRVSNALRMLALLDKVSSDA